MPKNKARCLIAGGTGFIGSALVPFLKERGYWVRVVDIQHHNFRRKLYEQADEVIIADMRDSKEALKATQDIQKVYWLCADHGGAGYFHSEADYPAAVNNMQIDLNVLKALKSDQRLFYSSSACAYPVSLQDKPGHALKETEIDHGPAERLYGSEKRQMLLFCNQVPNARVGIFSTIYGPGAEYEGIRAKFPTAICKRIADAKRGLEQAFDTKETQYGSKEELLKSAQVPIELWGDGSQERTFLYITDALEKIYRVMTSDKYEGAVNIGSDEVVTVKECADYVCESAGINAGYDNRTDKPTGVSARLPDNSKFNRLYGEVPQTSAKEGFIKTYEWIKEQ